MLANGIEIAYNLNEGFLMIIHGKNEAISLYAKQLSLALEEFLCADVLVFSADISDFYLDYFRKYLEEIKKKSKYDAIAVIIKTGGGLITSAEKIVNILRHNFNKVYFIVPEYAMSAGTLIALSGDRLYMNYASCLGPIDPQVYKQSEKSLVPAQGYNRKAEELLRKAVLTNAEILLVNQIDLGVLASYEEATNLSKNLLVQWLVQYKFKDWNVHRTNNIGAKVTLEEKQKRAEEIANDLADNKKWGSHGRPLNISKLNELRIEIIDYGQKDYSEFNKNISLFYETILSNYDNNQQIVIYSNIVER